MWLCSLKMASFLCSCHFSSMWILIRPQLAEQRTLCSHRMWGPLLCSIPMSITCILYLLSFCFLHRNWLFLSRNLLFYFGSSHLGMILPLKTYLTVSRGILIVMTRMVVLLASGGGPGCCTKSDSQDSPSQQRIIKPEMSIFLRLRNSGLFLSPLEISCHQYIL